MHLVRSKQMAIMTFILAILSLIASLLGIFVDSIYRDVFEAGTISENLIWGSIAQDIISVPLAIILGVLSITFLKQPSYKQLISMIGLAWYFFYAFGLYVIQGQYTSIYIVYLAIWGLSIYSMIWGLISFTSVDRYQLPRRIQNAISGYFIFTLCILGPGWIMKMLPDIQAHNPGDTYAVFIMDLTLVFPAFGIITYLLIRNKSYGNILAGIAIIKGFTLCLSWAFSQITGPFVGNPTEMEMIVISSILTIFGFVLFIFYLKNIKETNKT